MQIEKIKLFDRQRNYFFKSYKQELFEKAIGSKINFTQAYLLLSPRIIGSLLLMFFLSYLILYSFRLDNYLFLRFLLIFIITILTENILNRNQGATFTSLFINLLFFRNTSANNPIKL